MEKYSYTGAVAEDICQALKNYDLTQFESRDEAYKKLYDDFWVGDAVTGNGSGSYTCNAWCAEEHLCHNMDLLLEALEEFGDNTSDAISRGAEYCDVTIRCYLLGGCLQEVLDDIDMWN